MVSVEDWLDYLKWYLERLQHAQETNLRTAFAFGAVLIGSILAVAGSVFTANWVMLGVGIIGVGVFAVLLVFILSIGGNITRFRADAESILRDVILGTLKTPEEISAAYSKFLDDAETKYKRMFITEEKDDQSKVKIKAH